MSRTAKTTFVLSAALSTLVVVGVHWQQSAERESMYQGVLRDQARLDAKRAAAAAEAAEAEAGAAAGREGQQDGQAGRSSSSSAEGRRPSTPTPTSQPIIAPPLPPSQATPQARYQDWLQNREREEAFQRVQPTRAFLDRQRERGMGGQGDGDDTGWSGRGLDETARGI